MDLLMSKKFQVLVLTLILVVLKQYIPGLDEASIAELVGLGGSFVVGQGIADTGKERIKQAAKLRLDLED